MALWQPNDECRKGLPPSEGRAGDRGACRRLASVWPAYLTGRHAENFPRLKFCKVRTQADAAMENPNFRYFRVEPPRRSLVPS